MVHTSQRCSSVKQTGSNIRGPTHSLNNSAPLDGLRRLSHNAHAYIAIFATGHAYLPQRGDARPSTSRPPPPGRPRVAGFGQRFGNDLLMREGVHPETPPLPAVANDQAFKVIVQGKAAISSGLLPASRPKCHCFPASRISSTTS